MSLFIIRPKARAENRIAGAVAMATRSFAPARRVPQIAEVVALQRNDPIQRDIQMWLAARTTKPLTSPPLTAEPAPPQITGTVVANLTDAEAEQLRRDLPTVAVIPDRPIPLIEPNRAVAATAKTKLTPTDLWHLRAIGVIDGKGKRKTPLTGQHVTIAVLDTGIDASHAELNARSTGRVAAAYHFDTAIWQAIQQPKSTDWNGHGTHVAGLIAGKKVGVAPDAALVSGVILPRGGGNLSDFLLALDWVGGQSNIQIVNISAGIAGYVPELHEAIASLVAVGVLPVVATGNEGRNRTRSPGNYAEVMAVGSCNKQDWVSSFSSSGSLVVDNHFYTVPSVVAPGEKVYSCVPGAANTYQAWDGTSMATPIVSGLAALIIQKYPNITVADLVEAVFSTADYLPDEVEVRQGEGSISVNATTWFD